MYLPKRYFSGLSKTKRSLRKKELSSRSKLSWKTQKAYRPFKTDVGVKTRSSKYTLAWKKKFPKSTTISEAAQSTGVPASLIKKSHDRGVAAWRTGHRPGATKEQWGVARYRSMLLCGKTHYSTDADLVREAKAASSAARAWWRESKC